MVIQVSCSTVSHALHIYYSHALHIYYSHALHVLQSCSACTTVMLCMYYWHSYVYITDFYNIVAMSLSINNNCHHTI